MAADSREAEGNQPLPSEIRRAIPPAIGAVSVGLILFVAGFAVGLLADLPSAIVVVGAGFVVVIAVAIMAWLYRITKA